MKRLIHATLRRYMRADRAWMPDRLMVAVTRFLYENCPCEAICDSCAGPGEWLYEYERGDR